MNSFSVKRIFILFFWALLVAWLVAVLALFVLNEWSSYVAEKGGDYSTTFVSRPAFSPDSKKIAYVEYSFKGKYKGVPGRFSFNYSQSPNTHLIPSQYSAKLKILNFKKNKIEKEIDVSPRGLKRLLYGLGDNHSLQWKKDTIFFNATGGYNGFSHSNIYIDTDNWKVSQINNSQINPYLRPFLSLDGEKVIYFVGQSKYDDKNNYYLYSIDLFENDLDEATSSLAQSIPLEENNNCRNNDVLDLYKSNTNYVISMRCRGAQNEVKKLSGVFSVSDDGELNKIANFEDIGISLIKKGDYVPVWQDFIYGNNAGVVSPNGEFFAYIEENNFSVSTKYGVREVPHSSIKIIKIR